MSSQPLNFGELLAGGVLVTMGVTGVGIRDVFAGKAGHINPIGPAGSRKDAAFLEPSGAPAAGGARGGTTPEGLPLTMRAARALRGLSSFDGVQVAAWIVPYLAYARAHGWTGHVESGYRSESEQRRIYDSGVRPAAVPGTSNHEGKAFPRGAIDVTEAASLSQILSHIPGGSLLKWAGAADPVHFSFPHGGGY